MMMKQTLNRRIQYRIRMISWLCKLNQYYGSQNYKFYATEMLIQLRDKCKKSASLLNNA